MVILSEKSVPSYNFHHFSSEYLTTSATAIGLTAAGPKPWCFMSKVCCFMLRRKYEAGMMRSCLHISRYTARPDASNDSPTSKKWQDEYNNNAPVDLRAAALTEAVLHCIITQTHHYHYYSSIFIHFAFNPCRPKGCSRSPRFFWFTVTFLKSVLQKFLHSKNCNSSTNILSCYSRLSDFRGSWKILQYWRLKSH